MTLLADDPVLQPSRDKRGLGSATYGPAVDRAQHLGADLARPVETVGSEKMLTARPERRVPAAELELGSVVLGDVAIPQEVARLVPRPLAERHGLIPFARNERVLRIAVSDPFDFDGVDTLSHLLAGEVDLEIWLAPRRDIMDAIERVYAGSAAPNELKEDVAPADSHPVTRQPAAEESDAPVIKLVHELIFEASRRRASDIHVEPLEQRIRVRYRIDGVLFEMADLPKPLQLALVSRLKLMANISIAEKRLPQDGRFQLMAGERALDLRVSSLPTVYGESVVMRLLDRADLRPGLSELGLLAEDRARFEQLIASPNGLVLVTGPTGSGKTTTLYSCLHHLNKADRKIVTVEDPVEYQLSGINQVPVRHEIGMTFSSALRAMLRQAPNTVMVGEIRDRETAEIAINASLTGHVVFSTLHTNDATGAIARLADMGVKPFLLSASLRGVLAQRLVRKVCGHCRQPYHPTVAELAALGMRPADVAGGTLIRGAGCPECHGTGYCGRLGIFELLVLTEEFQQMLNEGASPSELRQKAQGLGMRTLREDGARKVIAGLTTIEEVVSMTAGDAS